MSLNPQKSWFKLMLTIAMALAPIAEYPAFAGSCTDNIVNQCVANQSSIEATQAAGSAINPSLQKGVASTYASQTTAGNAGQAAAVDCDNTKKACQKCPQAEQDSCKQAVSKQAQTMKTQASANQSSGASGTAIAGMMAGLAGAAIGYMMAQQQQQQNQPPPPPPVASGALQLNGSLTCQMADSYHYEDCETYLTQVCAPAVLAAGAPPINTTPTTGTIISSPGGVAATPDCTDFNANYCSSSVTAPTAYGYVRSDGSVTQVNLAGSGDGISTPYCANAVASAWCSESPVRATCPSCRQVATTTSAACAANPSLCLAQNSPQQNAQLNGNPACSGDPLYTPGSPYATGAGIITNVAGLPTGAPAVVLPQSATLAGTGGGSVGTTLTKSTGGAGTPSGTSGVSIASVSKAALGGAAREGKGVPTGGASGSGFGGAPVKFNTSTAHNSELIAAGGVIVAGGPSSISRGPASDVQSQFGPSLFATSTQVIRQRCEAGKLNNCP